MFKFAALIFIASLATSALSAPRALAQTAAPTPAQAVASSADTWIARALDSKLDERIEWRRLVHYVPLKIGRGVESQADNPRFFLAPDGKTDPRAELIATIRSSLNGEILPPAVEHAPAMAAICQFPARWSFLKTELKIPDATVPKVDCKAYDAYKARVQAQSVTVVFSGYYVNNPSTVYGHVLLRLNRARAGASNGSELLDYGVGYAANMTTSNPFLYAIYGVAGFFRGVFSEQQYFYKVREYSDAESRDLWEYDLALTPAEVERLVDHLWEMGSNYFDYYYLTENCAYHLLSVIEAAAPRLELLKRMPYFVIPVDSVRAISEVPGLVSKVHYRPSTQRVLETRYATLSPEEKRTFLRIRNEANPAELLKGASPESTAKILDTVLDDIDHRFFRELVYKSNPAAAARKQNVLMARAKLAAGGQIEVPVTERDRPDQSHRSRRWSLGGGAYQNYSYNEGTARSLKTMIDAEYRFSLHGLNDPIEGYLADSNVELGRVRVRYTPIDNQLDLKEFMLLSVASLAPVTELSTSTAWRVTMGARRVRDQRCEDCLSAYALGMAGVSLAPYKPWLVYALTGPVGETASSFQREKWLVSYGALLGSRLKFSPAWQLAAEAEARRVFDREWFDRYSWNVLGRWDSFPQHPSQFAIETEWRFESRSQDFNLRFLKYF